MLFTTFLASRLLITCAWTPQGSWLKGSSPPWEAHTGSISVTLSDGSILLMGGQKGEHGGALFDCFNCTKEVWRLEPEEEKWTDLSSDVPWDPRWGHSAAVAGDDTVWMMFGCCERGRPTVMLTDIWVYNPIKGMPWKSMDSTPPFEGIQATSVAFRGDDLWVVGGWSQQRGTLSQVAVLHTKTLKWTVKSDHAQVPWLHRADHATAISPNGEWLLLFAGQHRDAKTGKWSRLKDTWRVKLPEASAQSWKEIGGLHAQKVLSGARSSVPVLILNSGWLLILAGHVTPDLEDLKVKQEDTAGMVDHHAKTDFQTYNDIQALDLKDGGEGGWRIVEADAPWAPRDDCAAAVSKGALLLFGGGTLYGGGGYLRDVWKLPNAAEHYGLKDEKSGKSQDEL